MPETGDRMNPVSKLSDAEVVCPEAIIAALRAIREPLAAEERRLSVSKRVGGLGGWWEAQAYRCILDDAISRVSRHRRRVERAYKETLA